MVNIINEIAELKYSPRNTSVEVLRVFFMFLVVLLHGYYYGLNGHLEVIYAFGDNSISYCHAILYSLSRVGVTGFMFISGYYGVSLSNSKLLKLLTVVLFYYFVCYGFSLGMLYPYHNWWYVEAYLLVMLLSPAIELMFEKCDKRIVFLVVVGLLYYEYVGLFLQAKDSHDGIFLLTIYIFSRYFRAAAAIPFQSRFINAESASAKIFLSSGSRR